MLLRLRRWLFQLLVAIDQLGRVVLGGPGYLITGKDCPNADETISSAVGRHAAEGFLWARVVEVPINALFLLLTGKKDHCRSSIGY